jgi:osmoprotectant transport system substrate-binding protein
MVALVLALAACSSTTSAPAPGTALRDGAVTVGSFDFPESVLLAEIYGVALENRGYAVKYARSLGPRELVDPALARGLVELVPEYAGTALDFLSLGKRRPSSNILATRAALVSALRGSDLVPLEPAPAQDSNAIVVAPATARRYGLRTISDLVRVHPRLTFGGPPECPSRPFCLGGLRRLYGLGVKAFLPLDAGGPLTRQALEQNQVDVGLMFSTEPALVNAGLVALLDDRRLQPSENVTPLVNKATIEHFGPDLVDVVNRVSAKLTAADLRALNAQVAAGAAVRQVADDWLAKKGIA